VGMMKCWAGCKFLFYTAKADHSPTIENLNSLVS
jgi:hypothetical protein